MGERISRTLPPTGRNSTKSRTGCLICKQRHVKCDEKTPNCSPCWKKGYRCPGPSRSIRWSQKHQPTKFVGPNRRAEAKDSLEAQSLPPPTQQPLGPIDNGRDLDTTDTVGLSISSSGITSMQPTSHQSPISFAQQSNPPATQLSIPATPVNFDSRKFILTNHYFSAICPINSCFDTHYNPLRSYVGTVMFSCPFLIQCVMSMAAAHLFQSHADMFHVALNLRQQAVASLMSQSSLQTDTRASLNLLLGCILLGMTSSWHNASSIDVVFLHTARLMMKECAANQQKNRTKDHLTDDHLGTVGFIFGLLAYWEAMASFIFDQSLEDLDYLLSHDQRNDISVCPNPWTGISSQVFVYMAQVGALSRQRLRLSCTGAAHERIQSKQYKQAAYLERQLLELVPLENPEFIDPGDESTPLDHIFRLSNIYRLSALLQIYTCFPDLITKARDLAETTTLPDLHLPKHNWSSRSLVVSLAIRILNIIATIPEHSRVNPFLTLPLLISGSSLQCDSSLDISAQLSGLESALFSSPKTIESELIVGSTAGYIVYHWRAFVRNRLKVLYDFVALEPITRASLIVELVWTKSDTSVEKPTESSESLDMIQWMGLMMEGHLESIFG